MAAYLANRGEWNGDDGGLLAASLAFYTAFSFFPLLLVLLAIAGFVLRLSPQAQQSAGRVARRGSPACFAGDRQSPPADVMAQIRSAAPVGGPLGLATLLFGAIGIFSNMEVAFARIWKARDLPGEHRGWLHMIWQVLFVRLKAFVVVLILGLFIVATFFAGLVLSAVRRYVGDFPLDETLWSWVQIAIGYVLDVVFFMLTYRVFSSRKTSWWECLQGGLLAGIFWGKGADSCSHCFCCAGPMTHTESSGHSSQSCCGSTTPGPCCSSGRSSCRYRIECARAACRRAAAAAKSAVH